jgi:hypothetical protein
VHKRSPAEEDSVHRNLGDDASVAETAGDDAAVDDKQRSSSDEGRRLECGKFYTISSPVSNGSPSVHFSRHYFMLDGRIYWS